MKKTTIALLLIASSFGSHATDVQKEKDCLKATVEIKQVLAGEQTDAALTGFVNLIPEYAEDLKKQMEDPYRCSLK